MQIILVLLVTLGFVSSPSNASSDVEFVPPQVLASILALASNLPKDIFSTKDALCFQSAESSYGLGTVKNCIIATGPKDSRLWLMQQEIHVDSRNQNIKNLIATYIQTTADKTPVAYYLELSRDTFTNTHALEPINYKVPCVMCHASGPRLIRPTTASAETFTPAMKTLLTKMNQEISTYKIVKTFVPQDAIGQKLFPANHTHNAAHPFKLNACYQCHNNTSGVRAELNFDHAATIAYLAVHSQQDLGHVAMPAYDAPTLNDAEAICLKTWMKNPIAANEPSICPLNVLAPNTEDSPTALRATISTNLHSFDVRGFKVTLKPDLNESIASFKDNDLLSVSGTIQMNSLTSGISARDAHMNALIKASQYPTATFIGFVDRKAATQKTKFKLSWLGVTNDFDVAINCSKTICHIDARLDLNEWPLKLPSFLGIEVKPAIHIQGDVSNNQKSQYRHLYSD